MNILFRNKLLQILGLVMLILSNGKAQEELRKQYFNEASDARKEAQSLGADRYAPRGFEKAMKAYTEAADNYMKGKNLTDIVDKLEEAIKNFKEATERAKIGEAVFAPVRDAQTAASNADALHYATNLWNKTEQQFEKAQRDVEDGNLSRLQEKAKDLIANYRDAELEAIKTNYLATARDLIHKCDELNVKESAPTTLAKARSLLDQVEVLLSNNRYDTDTARQIAAEAKYEGSHALYLHKRISKDKQEGKTTEDYIIEAERALQQILSSIGLTGRFDEGYSKPVAAAVSTIQQSAIALTNRDEEFQKTKEKLQQKESENISLRGQVDALTARLTESDSIRHQVQRQMVANGYLQPRLRSLDSLFRGEPVVISSESTRIFIHILNVKIVPFSPNLTPQLKSLLSKVAAGIGFFPKLTVRVEGHNEDQDDSNDNLVVSGDKATTVKEYLTSIIPPTIPIVSEGYGDKRPLSAKLQNSETKRNWIDIVLIPDLYSLN